MSASHLHSHDHGHGHGHGHEHEHGHEHAVPQGGPVVFDIGGDVGALVLYVDDDLIGSEIPIEWVYDPSKDVHTGVWPRRVGVTTVTAAVYPELRAGRYDLPRIGSHGARSVDIVGGAVVEIDARTPVRVAV